MSTTAVDSLLSVDQAVAILDAAAVEPCRVMVPLALASGLVLASNILADRDYPPFDRSLMDGYAVCQAEAESGIPLRYSGEIAAGREPARPLAPGEVFAIMTGAPLPPGADAVVPVEQSRREEDQVYIDRGAASPRHISRRGSDVQAGDVVLERGARLEAAQIAVAATVGAAHVSVFGRPAIGVLCTGDEVVAPSATPAGAQIRDANSPMLLALLARMGCDAVALPHVPDDPLKTRLAIDAALERFDALLVTGGMSMGEHDYVPRALIELGVELKITKVRIKPGKPFVFGTVERAGRSRYVFGLPGNPVSAFVCTVRLAGRVLRRLGGLGPEARWQSARLATALPANGPREFYQPVKVDPSPDGPLARPLAWLSSADVFTLARADALLVRPAGDGPRSIGDGVSVLTW